MTERALAVELDIALDRTSPVPLYHQLAEAIEASIRSGDLKPGDRLENEVSLTARLGLARPTARQAIQELVKKGLLVRKRGVGTQVVHSQISRDTKLTSLYDDLKAAGHSSTTVVLEYGVGPLEDDVRQRIGSSSEADGDFVRIRRVRSADGEPLALLTNFLPARFRLTAEELGQRGLYECLRTRGVNLKIAHQSTGARLMSAEEAKLLDEERPAACLTMERTVYDDTGRLVEHGSHVYRATHYRLQTSLVT